MLKIRIETDYDGAIEREAYVDDADGLSWVDIAVEFGNALSGLGYKLPDDWDEYLERKMNQRNLGDNVFDDCECDHECECHK